MRKGWPILFCVIMVFVHVAVKSQKVDTVFFKKKEQKLVALYSNIQNSDSKNKLLTEKVFFDSLRVVLNLNNSFYFSFDSLKYVGQIKSQDEKLRLFTWNIPQGNGFHNYYCLIQFYDKKSKEYFVYSLKEQPSIYQNTPQIVPATIDYWPGALYYRVIDKKYKGQTYYTILGFNYNNLLSNYKVIEIITFNDKNKLVFPLNGFSYEGKSFNRIVFEYAESAQMMLEYDSRIKKIVFDHLSPQRPSLTEQFQFYGPDLSYDAMTFDDGVWIHESDINISD